MAGLGVDGVGRRWEGSGKEVGGLGWEGGKEMEGLGWDIVCASTLRVPSRPAVAMYLPDRSIASSETAPYNQG